MSFRLWGGHEQEPCKSSAFVLLLGQLGNRSRADPKNSGAGVVLQHRHCKTPDKRKSGTFLAWCAPPQTGEFLQFLNEATAESQEVPLRPANRHKAESLRAA